MILNLRGVGIELTPAIRQYAEDKMTSLEHYCDNIIHADVDLGQETKHHQKGDIFVCNAVVQVPGEVFKVEKQEENLYKAIDKVKTHLQDVLVGWKEKMTDRHRREE